MTFLSVCIYIYIFVLCRYMHLELRTTSSETNLNINNQDCCRILILRKESCDEQRETVDFTPTVLKIWQPESSKGRFLGLAQDSARSYLFFFFGWPPLSSKVAFLYLQVTKRSSAFPTPTLFWRKLVTMSCLTLISIAAWITSSCK